MKTYWVYSGDLDEDFYPDGVEWDEALYVEVVCVSDLPTRFEKLINTIKGQKNANV